MSDGAEVPWPESIWVQSDVQTLRDLYDNSVYHDSPTATFHLMMTPLRAILVPCGAWLSHPDIVRGFDEAEKLRKILLSHQKNQTASETSVSAPAHTASLAGGSAKLGPAPSACGDTLSIARNQTALEPSESAPAHASPLAGGSAKSGPAASACSDTLSIARNKKRAHSEHVQPCSGTIARKQKKAEFKHDQRYSGTTWHAKREWVAELG